jgi:hypothetical protein
MVPDMYHLSSLLLSDSKLIGSSGAHKGKLKVSHVYQGRDVVTQSSTAIILCSMRHSFGNYLLKLYLFVLVKVFNSIQQTFIEHYYQALWEIKINKA